MIISKQKLVHQNMKNSDFLQNQSNELMLAKDKNLNLHFVRYNAKINYYELIEIIDCIKSVDIRDQLEVIKFIDNNLTILEEGSEIELTQKFYM